MSDSTVETETASPTGRAVRHWDLRRIDIRSPVTKGASPVARLELEHPARGRVSDIGTAPGAFDAAFVAASHIVGVEPRLLSYNVSSGVPPQEGALPITIEVEIELDEERFAGRSSGVDLLRCSIEAWLDAIAKSGDD